MIVSFPLPEAHIMSTNGKLAIELICSIFLSDSVFGINDGLVRCFILSILIVYQLYIEIANLYMILENTIILDIKKGLLFVKEIF